MKRHDLLNKLRDLGITHERKVPTALDYEDMKRTLLRSIQECLLVPKAALERTELSDAAAQELGIPKALVERIRKQEGRIYLGIDPGAGSGVTHVRMEWREAGPIKVVTATVDLKA